MNIRLKFVAYLVTAIMTTAVLTIVFSWWVDASDTMLLARYGYNIDGMSEKEFYEHVSPKNMERVKSLVRGISGIGWPLKALFMYVAYLPYLLLICSANYLIQKGRKNHWRVS